MAQLQDDAIKILTVARICFTVLTSAKKCRIPFLKKLNYLTILRTKKLADPQDKNVFSAICTETDIEKPVILLKKIISCKDSAHLL